jgi:hypothetical protein
MAVRVNWHNPEKTALKLTFTAPWTWDEFEQVSRQIEAAFASVRHTVDLVVDITAAGDLPEDGLFRLRNVYSDPTPNLGEYRFVGASREFQLQFEAVDRYYTALGGKLDYRFIGEPQALP